MLRTISVTNTGTITTTCILVSLLSLLNSYSYGNNIEVAVYGGCLNRTLYEAGVPEGETPGFHCHFDSDSCEEGEEWLNQFEVEEEGLGPCTCDHNYKSNVYVHTCYDVAVTHQLICGSHGGCPEGLMDLGERFNSEDIVPDDCGHLDDAFGAFTGESCGKRCTCNYRYMSGTRQIFAGDTTFGVCRNTETNAEYCAVKNTTCADDETFFEHWNAGGRRCTCADTLIGACVDDATTTFSHCAVAADGCKATQTFLIPSELRSPSSLYDVDCRLCKNTWDPTESPTKAPVTPTDPPTESPTDGPTIAITPAPSTTPSREPTGSPSSSPTTNPTAAPSAPPTENPTKSPTSTPTTSAPTTSSSPTTVPTSSPTAAPSAEPSTVPTSTPTISDQPTISEPPSNLPTTAPTAEPSTMPTATPTALPSSTPTTAPSDQPTTSPPTTSAPTKVPTSQPSDHPTKLPSSGPTIAPTDSPSTIPSIEPTVSPTKNPTATPTVFYCTVPGSSCYKSHNWNGCNDSVCNSKVCASEPACCAKGKKWTESCTTLAAHICKACPCDERPYDKFLRSIVYDEFMGEPIEDRRTCNWLKNSATISQRTQLCNRFFAPDGSTSPRSTCPVTCKSPVC